MASIFRNKEKTHPGDIVLEFRATGVDDNGDTVYAEVMALEPSSIGSGGGGGGGGAVTVADGADVAQGTTTDASGTSTVVGLLKAIWAALGGTITVQGAQQANTNGTITTATTVVGPVDATNYNIATVMIHGTYAGVTIAFESSPDGTTWFPVQGVQTDAFVAVSSVAPGTNVTRAWDIPIGAFTWFRVRATAWTSGSAQVTIALQSMPYEPAPTVGVSGTAAVSGTVTAVGGASSTAATLLIAKLLATASTNANLVKSSRGALMGWHLANVSAAWRYVKLFNKSSAPVPGTDIPVLVLPIPPGGVAQVYGNPGINFATGIGYAITAGQADTDATATAAGDVQGTLIYI